MKVYFVFAGAALLCGLPANAQIVDVRPGTVGTVTTLPGPGTDVFINDAVARVYRSNSSGFGSGFAAFTDINETSIYFENGAMSAGGFNSARAVTDVAIDFVNGSATPTLAGIDSVIFESSFGFYIGEFNAVTGCSGATLPDCARVDSGLGFSGFIPGSNASFEGVLASVAFSFEVLYDGVLVRSIGGSIQMFTDGQGISFIEDFGTGEDSLFNALVDFGLDGASTDYSHVYRWDTTPFFVAFEDLLPPGEAATVTYRITTESWSQAFRPQGSTSDNMIIGYACVRDPVGRGGGRSAPLGGLVVQGNPDDNTCIDDISGFRGNVLDLPRVEDGIIVFQPGGVIPEPATWAMLITGFGVVGTAARRRRAVAAES